MEAAYHLLGGLYTDAGGQEDFTADPRPVSREALICRPPTQEEYTWLCTEAIVVGDAALIGADLGVEGPHLIFLHGGPVGY